MSEISELDLFQLFQDGDRRGLAGYYELYWASLRGYAAALTRDTAAAEDIVSEAFIELNDRRGEMENSSNVRNFLYLVVKNKCIDGWRRQKRQDKYNEERQRLYTIDEREIDADIVRKNVLAGLESLAKKELPEKLKEIYHLYFLESRSVPEIADSLHKSRHTVRNQVERVRKFLLDPRNLKGFLCWVCLFLRE